MAGDPLHGQPRLELAGILACLSEAVAPRCGGAVRFCMRLLGIDFGERRVGLAITDPSGKLARPLRTLRGSTSRERLVAELLDEIRRLSEEDGVSHIVIGLPLRTDGSPTGLTARVRALAGALAARTTVPVVLQDERLTSREAEQRLALREPDWRKRKIRLDAAAAAVILQDYVDEHRAPFDAGAVEPEDGPIT